MTRLARISLLVCLIPQHASGNPAPRPNVIFIMADDLGYGDLGCYGQKLIQTPHIDRLAVQGVRFTQAYAGSPVCAASRAVLMTGLHNGHAPARDNIPHYQSYLQEDDVTIAEVLSSVGYRCGGIGKWSLGDAGTQGRPTNQGFDGWFGYLNQDHAHYYYPAYLDDGDGRLELPDNWKSQETYSHHLMTEWALRFIRESSERPFFLYAAYTVPHYAAASEDETQFPVPSDAPYSQRSWSQQEKNYAAMVTLLDHDVGRIVTLVDELGLQDKTLIVFTSDNGPWASAPRRFHSAGQLRGAKRSLYEGGIRVPFIARWPTVVPRDHVSDTVIAFQDVMPTFAELAAAESPQKIDGVSLADELKGGSLSKVSRYLYWDYGHCRSRYDRAVRLGKWKGVRNGQQSDIELYDLSADRGEEHDISGQNTEIVRQIAMIMESAAAPSERYPIGQIYEGKPLWKRTWQVGRAR